MPMERGQDPWVIKIVLNTKKPLLLGRGDVITIHEMLFHHFGENGNGMISVKEGQFDQDRVIKYKQIEDFLQSRLTTLLQSTTKQTKLQQRATVLHPMLRKK